MYSIIINTYPCLDMQDKEFAEIVKGDEKIMETALSFMSRANSRIDACVDHTRPALSIDNEQMKTSVMNTRNRGVRKMYH